VVIVDIWYLNLSTWLSVVEMLHKRWVILNFKIQARLGVGVDILDTAAAAVVADD